MESFDSFRESLNSGDPHKLVLQSAQYVEQSAATRLVHAILQIKTENPAGALTTLSVKQTELQAEYDYARHYAHYQLNQYQNIVSDLKKNLSQPQKMLLAQSLSKLEKFDEAFEVYSDLMNQSYQTVEEHQDVLTNLINVAIQGQNQTMQEKVLKIANDYVKKQKGKVGREVMINQVLLNLATKDNKSAQEILNRLVNLIKLDLQDQEPESDEDYLTALLITDYINQEEFKETQLHEKIRYYEQLLTRQNLPKSVLPILTNNLGCLQERLFANHHETLKRFEDTLEDPKLIKAQVQRVKQNKFIVLVSRNRINEASRYLKEIQDLHPLVRFVYQMKHQPDQVNIEDQLRELSSSEQILGFLLVAQVYEDQPDKILELFRHTLQKYNKQWSTTKVLVELVLALLLKTKQNDSKIIEEIHQSGFLPDLCLYFMKNNNLDEALKIYDQLEKMEHPQATELRGRISLKFIEQNMWDKAERFIEELPFELVTNVMELEQLETNIQLTKTQRQKSQDLTDVIQKTIKKRRKRSRKPKNLAPDAKAPDPERWLPKYERKDYRKKKGAKLRGAQGAAVGKETTSIIKKEASSAAMDVSSKQSKNRKKR